MIIKDVIKEGTIACEKAGVYSGFARFLMLELLRDKGLDLYLLIDEVIDEKIHQEYKEKLDRILNNEPMGYVLGYQWFYGYKIMVNQNVLIPREETEELVGHILTDVDMYYDNPKIVDVACGSGAIGLALSKDLNTHVYASDISHEALEVAKENAGLLNADMTFLQGDMLEPFIKENLKFDILVCNPPYIKEIDDIASSVLEYEPHLALFGGDDGLYFYDIVLKDADKILNNKNSMIAFEIGFDIGEAVVELAKHYFPMANISLVQDINGLDRFVFVRNIGE